MNDTGCKTAEEVEKEIAHGTDSVFYVIAEDIEAPHIPYKMEEPSVQKHKGKKREELLSPRKMGGHLRNKIPGRDQAIYVDKFV